MYIPGSVSQGPGFWVATGPVPPFAEHLGTILLRQQRSLAPPGSAVYLVADDYMPVVEEAQGEVYDPQAWLSMLLCQYTAKSTSGHWPRSTT